MNLTPEEKLFLNKKLKSELQTFKDLSRDVKDKSHSYFEDCKKTVSSILRKLS
jgi:hypothetical protein